MSGPEKKLAAVIIAGILMQGMLGGVLRRSNPVPGPRSTVYDSLIRRTAKTYMPDGWDWRILKAMIHHESHFDPGARSTTGAALGLLQVQPATGEQMGYSRSELLNPRRNAAAGTAYLRKQWNRWKGVPDSPPQWKRTRLALAAYNAGPSAVRKAWRRADANPTWNAVKRLLPAGARSYVHRIMDELHPSYQKNHFGYAVGVLPGWTEHSGLIGQD